MSRIGTDIGREESENEGKEIWKWRDRKLELEGQKVGGTESWRDRNLELN